MNRPNRKFTWIVTLIIMFSGASIFADEKKPLAEGNKLPTGIGMGKLIVTWIDLAHATVSKKILSTTRRFDAFFGDERIAAEKQNTQIKVTTSVKLAQNQRPEVTFPISTNLALPHLENKVHLVVDTLLKENKAAAEDKKKDTDVKVSLRYLLLKKAREWVSLDGGARVAQKRIALDSLEPFATLRIRSTVDFDPWALQLTQFVNWFKNDGFSANSRLDLERRFSHDTLFRMTSNALWSENEVGTKLTQSLSLRWQLSHNQALGLELSGEGHTRSPATVDTYTVNLTYRRRIYKNWAFLGIEPGVQFLHADRFRRTPLILLNLEILFGTISK